MKVRIEIDTKTFVRFWLVVIGFLFVILAAYMARTALIILASAGFLALALSGPVGYLTRYIPGRSRIGASAVAFISVVLFLGMVIFLVVPPITEQTVKFINNAPQLVETVSDKSDGIAKLIDQYHLQPQIDKAIASAKNSTDNWVSDIGRNTVSGIGSLFGAIAATFLALVLAFLMLIEAPGWLKRIWSVYDDKETMEDHRKLASRMHHVVSGYVTGQLAVSGIGALCAGAAVFLLSLFIDAVPGNLALPTIAIAFTLSLIPMFGATIAGILVSILLAFNSITAGIIFAVYFIIYQQIENNFISPVIQSKYVKLSPLAILTAVTVGLYLFGLAGGIISIPIAGCIKVLIETHLEKTKKSAKASHKPMAKLVKKLQTEA